MDQIGVPMEEVLLEGRQVQHGWLIDTFKGEVTGSGQNVVKPTNDRKGGKMVIPNGNKISGNQLFTFHRGDYQEELED